MHQPTVLPPSDRPPNLNPSEQLRFIAALQRQKNVAIQLPLLGRDGKVTDAFATTFSLTPAERQDLQDAIEDAGKRLDEIRALNTTSRSDGDSFVISVKPFENGADTYDALMDRCAQTLGPERNAAFLALVGNQLMTRFDSFGAEERTLVFTRELRDGALPVVILSDMRKRPGGGGGGVSGVRDLDSLPPHYQWLARYASQIRELPVRQSVPEK